MKTITLAKCCTIPVGTFCATGDIKVFGFATVENGVMTMKYFGADGTEYVYTDLILTNCSPANPFTTLFTFNNDFGCDTGSMLGTATVTLSDVGGIVDGSTFILHFDLGGVQLISGDPNIVVDDIDVNEFRVVDAGVLTNPIVLTVRIPNLGCAPLDVVGEVFSISPLLGGWVVTTNTPDTLVYV